MFEYPPTVFWMSGPQIGPKNDPSLEREKRENPHKLSARMVALMMARQRNAIMTEVGARPAEGAGGRIMSAAGTHRQTAS